MPVLWDLPIEMTDDRICRWTYFSDFPPPVGPLRLCYQQGVVKRRTEQSLALAVGFGNGRTIYSRAQPTFFATRLEISTLGERYQG